MSVNAKLTRVSQFSLDMDEAFARRLHRALAETLSQFDTTDRRYIELVNKGHIDTLCVVRNYLSQEFS